MLDNPDIYLTGNYVVLDFETDTSHGDYGHPVHPDNGLVLACWSHGPAHPVSQHERGHRVHAFWGGEFDQEKLLESIEVADLLVAHNAKYELGWLKRCGLDLSNIVVFDTKIAEYVLLGNLAGGDKVMPPRSTSLDQCVLRRGGKAKDPVVDTMIGHGINPVSIPRAWLEGRCRQDVRDTEALFLRQRQQLSNTGRLPVLFTRCLITPMLAEMEFQGMALDPKRVAEVHAEYTQKYSALDAELETFTGGINWGSDKQLAEYLYNPPKSQPVLDEEGREVWERRLRHKRSPGKLTTRVEQITRAEADKILASEDYIEGEVVQLFTSPGLGFAELKKYGGEPKRTAGGAKKTDSDTLDALVAKTAKQKTFIRLRSEVGKVQAAISKSLDFFHGICTEYGGKFHAVFNQTVTATHRLSSSGIRTLFKTIFDSKGHPAEKSVQFHNLANAFKPLFCASKRGWGIAEVDGSQLEFRVAAQLSRDKQMVQDILDPHFDAHITSASAMYGIPYDELYQRFVDGDPDAKKLRKEAKPETFGPLYGKEFGTPEQVRWIEAFRARYSGFYEWSEANVHTVLSDHVLITPWGMRYYWPYAKISSSGYVNVKTSVYNYPIQAFATAEIIPIAIRAFWERVQKQRAGDVIRPINTVHDSLISEVKKGSIDLWKEIAIEAFTTDVYAYLRKVYKYEFGLVPLGVGLNWGKHWQDDANSEEEYNVFSDGRRVAAKA